MLELFKNLFNYIGGWDVAVVLVFVLSAVLFVFLFKKEKVMALILSIYLAFIFVEEFAILNASSLKIKLISANEFFLEVLFIIIIAVFLKLFLKTGFFKSYKRLYEKRKIIFLNILTLGLFISISLHYFLPPYISNELSLFIKFIFIFPISFFLWLIIPMLSLFLVKR